MVMPIKRGWDSPTEHTARVSTGLGADTLLGLICWYLLGVPVVTSLNGLSLHIFGVSSIGPLYHVFFSVLLICTGLIHPKVEKNYPVLLAIFGSFVGLVGVQLVLGFSAFAVFDLGQLYKWYMPLLLFAVYYRWSYLRKHEAARRLSKVFQNVPLVYSIAIVISVLTFVVFGFNPTLFAPGTLRFTGFSFGYNTTVNAFLICAYANYVLLPTAAWRKLIYALSFVAMNSKTAVIYFAFIGLSFVVSALRARRVGMLFVVVVLPIVASVLAMSLLVGYQLTTRAPYARLNVEKLERGDVTGFALDFLGARQWWWNYAVTDVPKWPTLNLIVGNGMQVDRRVTRDSTFEEWLGSRIYGSPVYSKESKTFELDGIAILDLFGVCGAAVFAGVFYIYPFFSVRQPYFRIFQSFLVFLSLAGGHVINNPQTATLLVFLILFLRNYVPSRRALAKPVGYGASRTPDGAETSSG